MSFFPLDRDILKSSVWLAGSPSALKVWIYLMLEADSKGVCRDSALSIARATNLERDLVEEILVWLESPDPDSHTKTDDGRRIRRSEDGISLVNYEKYRTKDYSTGRTRRFRERQKNTVPYRSQSFPTVPNRSDRSRELPTPTPTPTPTEERIPADKPREPKKPSWSKDACDDWIARFGGTANGGAIGRQLKPLVDKHGWPAVRAAWKRYLEAEDEEYASPAGFATKFGKWHRAEPAAAPPAEEPLPPPDASAFHFFEAMKVRLAGVISLNSHSTWIRPCAGRAWETTDGDHPRKVLVITVPTQQFREQIRTVFADRMRGAAAEMGVPDCAFRLVVRPIEQAELHDGSIR